jgi:hypothetical protein
MKELRGKVILAQHRAELRVLKHIERDGKKREEKRRGKEFS